MNNEDIQRNIVGIIKCGGYQANDENGHESRRHKPLDVPEGRRPGDAAIKTKERIQKKARDGRQKDIGLDFLN
ncbi:hypothetical protein ACFOD7_12175 [Paracoccus fontiphilus]|uniref:Uncharacterized protein n=1 Tax=Paracoccus fontiphilus TaxID=1815556 RepID=A0ABV7IDX1_9RHOB